MSKWVIEGASLETGQDVRVVIDAATPQQVTDMAKTMRIAVRRVDIDREPPRAPRIEDVHVPPHQTRPVVIEQTSKKHKLLMLIGGLSCVGGIVGVFVFPFIAAQTPRDPVGQVFGQVGTLVSLLAIPGGAVTYIVARVTAWWNHG